VANNEFLEWEEVYPGLYYGTLKSEIDSIWKSGCHVVFDVDVKGGMSIKKYFGTEALSIYVMPPSLEELENRLRNRLTENEESLHKRLDRAVFELSVAPQFDKIIINDDLERTVAEAFNMVSDFLKL
jgi:guanylate kinase